MKTFASSYNISSAKVEHACKEYKSLLRQKKDIQDKLQKITKFFNRAIQENCIVDELKFEIVDQEKMDWKKAAMEITAQFDCILDDDVLDKYKKVRKILKIGVQNE